MSIFSKLFQKSKSNNTLFDDWMEFYLKNESWINHQILFKTSRCPFDRERLLEMLGHQADDSMRNGLWDKFKGSFYVHLAIILKFRMQSQDLPLYLHRIQLLNAEMQVAPNQIEFLKTSGLDRMQISIEERAEIERLLSEAKDFCLKNDISYKEFLEFNLVFAPYLAEQSQKQSLESKDFIQLFSQVSSMKKGLIETGEIVVALAEEIKNKGTLIVLSPGESKSKTFYRGLSIFIDHLFEHYEELIYGTTKNKKPTRLVTFIVYAIHEVVDALLESNQSAALQTTSVDEHNEYILVDVIRILEDFKGDAENEIRAAFKELVEYYKDEDFRKNTFARLAYALVSHCKKTSTMFPLKDRERRYESHTALALHELKQYAEKSLI